jgi:glycine cleavage system H protein
MSGDSVPEGLHYTKSHEWIRSEGGELILGITDHAQAELTDIVFVDLPEVGKLLKAGDSALVLESVKTVADVYAPTDATVVAVNAGVKTHPELVNKEPYTGGWLVRLKPTVPLDTSKLMDAAAYRTTIKT